MKVGIDLGTTYSVIATLDEDGDPRIIRNSEGEEKTPSVVQFREDQPPVIGTPAVNDEVSYAGQTVRRVKRKMGDPDWTKEILGQEYTAPEISARILEKLKRDAETETGEDIEDVVITVPAEFGTREREFTTDAAVMAGFDESDVSLLTEPVSACLRYGIDESSAETVFVYDMGGGTFDATVVRVDGDEFEVEGTKGGKRLGGEDFDEKLYEHVRELLIEQGDPDPEESESFKADVMREVREAKHGLSGAEDATIGINVGRGEVRSITVTRDEFEDLTEDLVEASIEATEELFDHENVSVTKNEIDRVLLVGGSTRIPRVQEAVEEYFGFEPSQDLRQDFVVAEGAAIQTEREIGGDGPSPTTNVLPETIGVAVHNEASEELVFSEIMAEQTKIPPEGTTESKRGFHKVDQDSTRIEIQLLEGGETLAEDNDDLAKFYMENLEPGENPEFEIEFEVTSEGRLTAEVTNLETGQTVDHTLEIGLDETTVNEGREQIKLEQEARDELTEA